MGIVIPYTEDEKRIIRQHYYSLGAVGVASLLQNRTRGAIKKWAYQNGVKVSKEYRSRVATAINLKHKRNMSDEQRKNIGDGHRKYDPFKCEDCGKKIAHYATRCWDCNVKNRRKNVCVSDLARRLLYPVWIFPIMARDNFTCQACGSNRNLNVHHIKRLRRVVTVVIKQYGRHPNTPEHRYFLAQKVVESHTLDDGITYCEDCHMIVHGKKRGELSGKPTMKDAGNQQPSRGNVVEFVPRKVQRLTAEDITTNKADTSAPLAESLPAR